MILTDKIREAIHFASEAHKDQKRKVLGYPYISHPLSVLFLISRFTENEDTLTACVLHDIVEDTDYSLDDIESRFGKRVGEIVDTLTEDYSIPEKDDRKNNQLEKFGNTDNEILLIKSADIIQNLCDIMLVLRDFPKEKYLNTFGGGIRKKISSTEIRIKVIETAWPQNPLLPELWQRSEDYKNTLERLGLLEL